MTEILFFWVGRANNLIQTPITESCWGTRAQYRPWRQSRSLQILFAFFSCSCHQPRRSCRLSKNQKQAKKPRGCLPASRKGMQFPVSSQYRVLRNEPRFLHVYEVILDATAVSTNCPCDFCHIRFEGKRHNFLKRNRFNFGTACKIQVLPKGHSLQIIQDSPTTQIGFSTFRNVQDAE